MGNSQRSNRNSSTPDDNDFNEHGEPRLQGLRDVRIRTRYEDDAWRPLHNVEPRQVVLLRGGRGPRLEHYLLLHAQGRSRDAAARAQPAHEVGRQREVPEPHQPSAVLPPERCGEHSALPAHRFPLHAVRLPARHDLLLRLHRRTLPSHSLLPWPAGSTLALNRLHGGRVLHLHYGAPDGDARLQVAGGHFFGAVSTRYIYLGEAGCLPKMVKLGSSLRPAPQVGGEVLLTVPVPADSTSLRDAKTRGWLAG